MMILENEKCPECGSRLKVIKDSDGSEMAFGLPTGRVVGTVICLDDYDKNCSFEALMKS